MFSLYLPLQNSCAAVAVLVAATVGSAAAQGLAVVQERLLEFEVLLAPSLLSVYHYRCLVCTCTNQAISDELPCTLRCLFLRPFLSSRTCAPI